MGDLELHLFESHEPVWPFTFRLEVEAAPRVAPECAADDDLPEAARAAVTRIRRRAAALVDRAGEFTPESKDLYIVEQLHARYLPDALDEYRALPADLRSAPITPDGRSGEQVLRHELELMETRLVAIADQLDRRKGDDVVVHERFLEEQLGGTDI